MVIRKGNTECRTGGKELCSCRSCVHVIVFSVQLPCTRRWTLWWWGAVRCCLLWLHPETAGTVTGRSLNSLLVCTQVGVWDSSPTLSIESFSLHFHQPCSWSTAHFCAGSCHPCYSPMSFKGKEMLDFDSNTLISAI